MSLRDQLSDGLARLAALARQEDWSTGEVEGLTPTQGDILRLLAARPQGTRLTTIAAQLQVSQPTASDAASTLERKGLLAKQADPLDGRAVLLSATRSGKALAKRWPAGFGSVADSLSVDDQTALLGILTRAIFKLQRQGAISPQRMCLSCRHFRADAHPGKSRQHHCGFIDAPIGDADLRIECADHEEAA